MMPSVDCVLDQIDRALFDLRVYERVFHFILSFLLLFTYLIYNKDVIHRTRTH
jgi:hypothetical protein